MMLVLVGGVFAAVCAKLVAIQGFDSANYLAKGGSEWERVVTLPGERGAILDRDGYELAMSVPRTTFYADPKEIKDPAAEAATLAPILGVPVATLQQEMSQNTTFVYIARTVADSEASQIESLNLAGIYSQSEPKRFNSAGQLASPLLGAVGTDGSGLGGLEYKYNSLLAGHAGKKVEEIDPQGQVVPGGVQDYKAPVAGDDVVTTIDEPLQYQAEQALGQALVASGARQGIALVMDTQTGDVLADAELAMPSGSSGPSGPSGSSGSNQTPALPVTIPAPPGSKGPQAQPVEASTATSFTKVYEPGSVNKLITVSAALQQGLVKPSDVFNVPNAYNVAGTWIHDAENHPTEHWNVTDILTNSSNIGTTMIAQKLGESNLLKYVSEYGLGAATPIDFPGESPGLLPTYWSGTSIADVSFGQGIAVTAVQMLAAYNAIANGGVYVPPRLVEATVDPKGQEHYLPIGAERRVVSPTVAQEMTAMLEQVVQVGTGRAASLDPYTVAGKTGTALVPSPTGGYIAGHYVASFAGFVPAEKPQITAMVVVDNTPDYGAAASAPTFAAIARDALQDFSIPPQPKQHPVPGVPIATPQSATGAGEVAGAPLAGLQETPTVTVRPQASTTSTTSLPPTSTSTSNPPTSTSSTTSVPPTTFATIPKSTTTAATTATANNGH